MRKIQETDELYIDLTSPYLGGDVKLELIRAEKEELMQMYADNIESLSDAELETLYEEVMNAINIYNDIEQNMKLDGNGMYGYMGAPMANYSTLYIAADITAEGRMLFKGMDVAITKLFNNELDFDGQKRLDKYLDFNKLKSLYGDIVRIEERPTYVPHLVQVQKVRQTKRRGSKGNPIIENIGESTYHSVVYGDTDSTFIGLDNFLYVLGVDLERDNPERISQLCLWLSDDCLIPMLHDVIEKMLKHRNINKSYHKMECEQITYKGHFYAPKCYALALMIKDGKEVWDKNKLKAGGIAIQKGSYPNSVKKKLTELLKQMMLYKQKDTNTLVNCALIMDKHIKSLINDTPVEELLPVNTVKVFEKYTTIIDERYTILPRADFMVKGMCYHNNYIRDRREGVIPGGTTGTTLLGNGSKVKTIPHYQNGTLDYFSWDIEEGGIPSYAPQADIDEIIWKNYTKNALKYLLVEYPQLERYYNDKDGGYIRHPLNILELDLDLDL